MVSESELNTKIYALKMLHFPSQGETEGAQVPLPSGLYPCTLTLSFCFNQQKTNQNITLEQPELHVLETTTDAQLSS